MKRKTPSWHTPEKTRVIRYTRFRSCGLCTAMRGYWHRRWVRETRERERESAQQQCTCTRVWPQNPHAGGDCKFEKKVQEKITCWSFLSRILRIPCKSQKQPMRSRIVCSAGNRVHRSALDWHVMMSWSGAEIPPGRERGCKTMTLERGANTGVPFRSKHG